MSEALRVLIVEDEPHQREALAGLLSDEGFVVTLAETVAQGQRALADPHDALITDFHLPDGTGLDLIRDAHALSAPPATLLVTAYGTVPLAVEAMREGAVDVQLKPIDPAALLATLRRALKTRALEVENQSLRMRLAEQARPEHVVAESPSMRRVVEQATQVARSKANVLVTGESGTGKEVVARLVHGSGRDADAPFVAVNCAALPDTLLEAELFGHQKGAFTGASEARIGRFEEAAGGTLFLDEIGEVPLPVQVKLLRVLQEREIVRLGENEPRSVDFRLVAATNVDLEAEVRAGRFREDLYYRLHVVRLHLPPLRERPQDLRVLVGRFLHRLATKNDVPPRPLSQDAMAALLRYEWPGNVRQLENVLEGALLVATGTEIEARDLSLGGPAASEEPLGTLPEILEATERRLIRAAIAQADGVTSAAAEILGIPDRTLRYKIRKLGLGDRGKD